MPLCDGVYSEPAFLGGVGGRGFPCVPVPTMARSNCIVFSGIVCPFGSIDNLKSQPPAPDQDPCLLPGFRVLNDFLAHHVHIPEVYLIVSAFFLQTPLTELTGGPKVGPWGPQGWRDTLGFLLPHYQGSSLRLSISSLQFFPLPQS